MWIVNEQISTRHLTVTIPPADEDKEPKRVSVEFEPSGRAQVSEVVAKYLVETFDPIRKAKNKDDVARAWTALQKETASEAQGASDDTDPNEEG